MIQLRGLRAGYPGRTVLEGIDLDFRPGEVLAILGPNGCGKSTLLRTANGLLPRTGGEVLVDGVSIDRLTPRDLARKAAYLPQSRQVPAITARRMVLHGRFPYLSYPRRYSREDRAMVSRALDWAGAAELADRPLAELSGGQRQKVYLAMALAQDTAAILMDEPTTYLDVACQLEVMALARRLAEEGRAVVMVLHDLCLALRCAHRAALVSEGRLCQVGSPEELFRGGELERVMGMALGRVETGEGWRYYYR
ncbi:MAG: ABC transporter ATP-binding protein [Lawsonibacter sp.]|jgi:iron complex transport system ATP-binding protein|uniref:ABC transporter ATP-binding protein n=1 Tax=Lawsonibacter sp. JLR.KK007 TaxID=3114293 RepID=UPI00216E2341|nr:ABC transporter ATP-binding protein [Lawsonibacter sp.]MCI8990517.1 ABC transporter ATP-binding protein [Lawsonibacter sp.]MCI9268830.1 ABC transporter ATP-binding protein [Lawsonibacter sp.]